MNEQAIIGSGTLEINWEGIPVSFGRRRIPCPWGCVEYVAWVVNTPGPLKHVVCYGCGNHGWAQPPGILNVLQEEEAKFRSLLKKFENHKTMSAEKACVLWHSQGCPEEIAEDLADDPVRFRELCADHRSKGGVKARQVF